MRLAAPVCDTLHVLCLVIVTCLVRVIRRVGVCVGHGHESAAGHRGRGGGRVRAETGGGQTAGGQVPHPPTGSSHPTHAGSSHPTHTGSSHPTHTGSSHSPPTLAILTHHPPHWQF